MNIDEKNPQQGKGVEKLEPSYTAGRNVKCWDPCGKVWQFPKKLNTELPYDTAIPLPVYTQKNWKQGLKEVLYASVHCSTIHNSQKVGATKLSIDR